jgi:hypothetical protein
MAKDKQKREAKKPKKAKAATPVNKTGRPADEQQAQAGLISQRVRTGAATAASSRAGRVSALLLRGLPPSGGVQVLLELDLEWGEGR